MALSDLCLSMPLTNTATQAVGRFGEFPAIARPESIVRTFTEDTYFSKLTLSIDGALVHGQYAPPCASKSRADESAFQPGSATLVGRFEGTSTKFAIRGDWQHVDGPLSKGAFEVCSEVDGSLSGWWVDAVSSDSAELAGCANATTALEHAQEGLRLRTPWTWKTGTSSLVSKPLSSKVRLFESSKAACEEEQAKMNHTADDPEMQAQVSFKSTTRSWQSWLVSVHMERFTMLSAWLFAAQTLCQLLGSLSCFPSPVNTKLNVCFNAVYSIIYGFFLCVYATMELRPAPCYVAGIALYFLGYVAFACIYGFDMAGLQHHAAWYHAGSWLFLLGSMLLLRATMPVRGSDPTAACLYSPLRLRSAAWWGSACFLVGSLLFVADAMQLPCWGLSQGGLSIFFVGRLFFLRASQTDRCDCLLRWPRSEPGR